MVNHFRTLLANVPGVAGATTPDYLGEEVVDPDFRPVPLPEPAARLRAVLFGVDPDRHMVNVRCAQILAVVHATPLRRYVYDLDRRVTYDFRRPGLADPAAWAPRVRPAGGDPAVFAGLTVSGIPDPPDDVGRVCTTFRLTVRPPRQAVVVRLTPPEASAVVEVDGGRLEAGLPRSGWRFRLAVPDGSFAAAASADVAVYARPVKDVGRLLAEAAALGGGLTDFLFAGPDGSPFAAFRRAFFAATEVPLRVAALACGLVYRTEERRPGGRRFDRAAGT